MVAGYGVGVHEMKRNTIHLPLNCFICTEQNGLHECNEFLVQVREIDICTGVKRRFDISH